jgi:hypothetical protein
MAMLLLPDIVKVTVWAATPVPHQIAALLPLPVLPPLSIICVHVPPPPDTVIVLLPDCEVANAITMLLADEVEGSEGLGVAEAAVMLLTCTHGLVQVARAVPQKARTKTMPISARLISYALLAASLYPLR